MQVGKDKTAVDDDYLLFFDLVIIIGRNFVDFTLTICKLYCIYVSN